MRWLAELNIFFAPMGGLILVALDYTRSQSLNRIQRGIMLLIAGSATLAIVCEILSAVNAGVPGESAYSTVYASCFLFFIFQLLAFSGISLFLDYYINQDAKRVKKLFFILGAISAAHLAVLFINLFGDFYFYVTPDSRYVRGNLHFIRVLFACSSLVITVADCFLSRSKIGPHQAWLCAFFIIPASLSGLLDLTIPGSRLLWPCFSLSLLFAHLFMVKADYSRDGLTGLYNRRRCNEFFAEMARAPRRKPCLFLMIDMDNFKRINENFGHTQGDLALKDVAGILKNAVRHRDFVARYGGDEFLLVLEDSSEAQGILDRIKCDLDTFNGGRTRPYVLEMSVGHGVYYPEDRQSPQEFLEHVDRRMFQNKLEQRTDRLEIRP